LSGCANRKYIYISTRGLLFMRTGNTSQVIERPQKNKYLLTHKERKKEAENPRFH